MENDLVFALVGLAVLGGGAVVVVLQLLGVLPKVPGEISKALEKVEQSDPELLRFLAEKVVPREVLSEANQVIGDLRAELVESRKSLEKALEQSNQFANRALDWADSLTQIEEVEQ